MASLHRTQYANNPRHAPRNPTTYLTYLGSTPDGYSAPTWLVHGSETTDVSTCGTGHPTRGMQYLGAAQDPDTGRGWMVRCDRQSSKVTPRLPAPPANFANWSTWFGNFYRYNAWTVETGFHWQAAEQDDGPGHVNATNPRYEARPSDEYPFAGPVEGSLVGYGNTSFVDPSSSGISSEGFRNITAGEEGSFSAIDISALLTANDISFEDWAVPSICRFDGNLYAEIVVYTDSSETESVYAARINVAKFDEDGEPSWNEAAYVVQLYTGPYPMRATDTDLILCRVNDPDPPPPEPGDPPSDGTMLRLAAIGMALDTIDGTPNGNMACYTIDALTGENLAAFEIVDLDFNAYDRPVSIPATSPRTFSDGTGRIWITDFQDTALISVSKPNESNPGGGNSWNTDTLKHSSLPSHTHGFALVGVAGNIAYVDSNWEVVETVTDTRIFSNDNDLWGTSYSAERIEVAAGHGYHRGVLALNASSGAYIGRVDYPGEPILFDSQPGPRVDTVYDDEFTFSIPRGLITVPDPGDPGETMIVDGPVDNLLAVLRTPQWTEYFYRVGTYVPGDPDNPYTTHANQPYLGGTGSGYSGDDPASAPHIAIVDAIATDFAAWCAEWVDSATAVRLATGAWEDTEPSTIKAERARSFRTSFTLPQHRLGVIGDPEAPYQYMDLNHTSILGIEEPITFPDPPVPRMGTYFGFDRRNLNSLRRFPVHPSIPADPEQAGTIISGVFQRWTYPDEYRPYVGAPDLGPFTGLYSIPHGEQYEASYSWSGAVGDGAAGFTMRITMGVVWEGVSLVYTDRNITPPPNFSAFGAFDGTSFIHGPLGGEYGPEETLIPRPIEFSLRTGLEWDWLYTYPTSEICFSETPIVIRSKADPEDEAARILYYTFIHIPSDDEWRCVILDRDMTLIGDPVTPPMPKPIYRDGEFWSGDALNRWKPPAP